MAILIDIHNTILRRTFGNRYYFLVYFANFMSTVIQLVHKQTVQFFIAYVQRPETILKELSSR